MMPAGTQKGNSAGQTNKRVQWLCVVGACACASVPIYVANPSDVGFYPRCPIHSLTGFYCPGCGTTRALHQLMHGNLGAALRLNPLTLLLLPVLAYSWLSFTLEVFKGKALPNIFGARLITALLIGTTVAFAVLRNIPNYPFTLLAPNGAGKKGAGLRR